MAIESTSDPETRKWSNDLQAKGVSQPKESVRSKPTVQQRPSGKEGVHPFEIATTAATPKEDTRARESFITGIEGIQGGVKKNDDEEANRQDRS